MKGETADHASSSPECPASLFVRRAIVDAGDLCIGEYTCRYGPRHRPFEERHERVTIAAVIQGSFQYRSEDGKALLYPGSFLLGNAGACFECGHDHATGDRCISFQYARPFFEEIASSAGGSYRFRFPAGVLPPVRTLAAPFIEIEAMAQSAAPIAAEDLALRIAETVVQTVSGFTQPIASLAARDERRVSTVLRYIEENTTRPLTLDDLAGVAAMSKYHFLRTFRRVTGVTPYGYLLGLRMRRAAFQLRTGGESVTATAFDAGFGDLSTFNKRFREVVGTSPSLFRKTSS